MCDPVFRGLKVESEATFGVFGSHSKNFCFYTCILGKKQKNGMEDL